MKKYFKNMAMLVIAVMAVSVEAQGQIYYSSTDAKELALKHNTIAIVPPNITFYSTKNIDAETIKEQQKIESENFQREISSWLLKRKGQGKFSPETEIQELVITNAKLRQAGYPEKIFSAAEICEILDVDGILISNYTLSKPLSTGAAIALAVFVGISGPTNAVNVVMNVHDRSHNKMIWNYSRKINGGLGSSPATLVDMSMRNASKKMPYFLKKKR